jgi:hypothetical protein
MMKNIKMISGLVPANHLEAMLSALRSAGLPVKEVGETGYVLRLKSGQELFRAMVGTRGDYLVRSADGLLERTS